MKGLAASLAFPLAALAVFSVTALGVTVQPLPFDAAVFSEVATNIW